MSESKTTSKKRIKPKKISEFKEFPFWVVTKYSKTQAGEKFSIEIPLDSIKQMNALADRLVALRDCGALS